MTGSFFQKDTVYDDAMASYAASVSQGSVSSRLRRSAGDAGLDLAL
jgi:hypothetical protein